LPIGNAIEVMIDFFVNHFYFSTRATRTFSGLTEHGIRMPVDGMMLPRMRFWPAFHRPGQVQRRNAEGAAPYQPAKRWIKENPKKVEVWIAS
jgi:hypothetical protein